MVSYAKGENKGNKNSIQFVAMKLLRHMNFKIEHIENDRAKSKAFEWVPLARVLHISANAPGKFELNLQYKRRTKREKKQ